MILSDNGHVKIGDYISENVGQLKLFTVLYLF